MAHARPPGWAGHHDAPSRVVALSRRTKATATNASTTRPWRRTHALSLMRFTLSHLGVVARAAATFGRQGTYESRGPGRPRNPSSHRDHTAGRYRGHRLSPAMEDMQTEPELTRSTCTPQPGHYDIDVSRSSIAFRTRHM